VERTQNETRISEKDAGALNISWSQKILQALYADGVRDVIYCAGARNSPLVMALSQSDYFQRHSFFEERVGSFFALGVARRTGRPVAVFTTSGTAVTELISAAAEAFYSGVPLVIVTADRPRRLRGTGAPQAIDQTGLFKNFAALEFDLENGEMFSLAGWNQRAPVHINICIDEPLIDEPLSGSLPAPDLAGQPESREQKSARLLKLPSTEEVALLEKFVGANGPASTDEGLLIVVGTLESSADREAVLQFLLRVGCPVYIEATSGLRERPELGDLSIRSGDRLLSWAIQKKQIKRVLRIGGVPTVRIWRDLDDQKSTIEVLSLTSLPFAGLSRGQMICAEIAPLVSQAQVSGKKPIEKSGAELLKKDREVFELLQKIFADEPLAEPSLIRELSGKIPNNSLLYIGNSLPIREWDLAAKHDSQFAVEANRGVNGIDGQIATFLGLAKEKSSNTDRDAADVENWAIIGDLTALYDLAAPWAIACRSEMAIRIVIVNNGGGKIFSRIFKTDFFENSHRLEFQHWAKMWNLGYQRWSEIPQSFNSVENLAPQLSLREVIELVPDEAATQRFWDRYDALWK
jgi:2-succinyl-5-enolpyruvyl-6-hydroxy-3-cyclohexene-1-carboxylate synthase